MSDIHLGDIVYKLKNSIKHASRNVDLDVFMDQFVVTSEPREVGGKLRAHVTCVGQRGEGPGRVFDASLDSYFTSLADAFISLAEQLEEQARTRQDTAQWLRDLAK